VQCVSAQNRDTAVLNERHSAVIATRDLFLCERLRSALAVASVTVLADCHSMAELGTVLRRHRPDVLFCDARLLPKPSLRRLGRCASVRGWRLLVRDASELRNLPCGLRPIAVNASESEQQLIDSIAANSHSVDSAFGILPDIGALVRPRPGSNSCVLVRSGSHLQVLALDEVEWVTTNGIDTVVRSFGRDIRLQTTLEFLRKKLPAKRFASINRNTLVNIDYVREVCFATNSVVMLSGTMLSASSVHLAEVLRTLAYRAARKAAELTSTLATPMAAN